MRWTWPVFTVNVDIFTSINFRAFPKIGNFAQIYIRVFNIVASMWYYARYFQDVHIFRGHLINVNNAKICPS